MNCPACRGGRTTVTSNNFEDAKKMRHSFQVHVPLAEIWACGDCGAAWGYADGVLYLAGTATTLRDARVPDGALAAFGWDPVREAHGALVVPQGGPGGEGAALCKAYGVRPAAGKLRRKHFNKPSGAMGVEDERPKVSPEGDGGGPT